MFFRVPRRFLGLVTASTAVHGEIWFGRGGQRQFQKGVEDSRSGLQFELVLVRFRLWGVTRVEGVRARVFRFRRGLRFRGNGYLEVGLEFRSWA